MKRLIVGLIALLPTAAMAASFPVGSDTYCRTFPNNTISYSQTIDAGELVDDMISCKPIKNLQGGKIIIKCRHYEDANNGGTDKVIVSKINDVVTVTNYDEMVWTMTRCEL